MIIKTWKQTVAIHTLWLSLALVELAVFALAADAAPAKHRQSGRTLTTEQLCDRALGSVVELKVRDDSGELASSGSGFVVGKDLVATNWHVVKGAHTVSASFRDGRSEEVYGIVGSDQKHDVVIVWVNTGNVKPLPLSKANAPRIGSDVVAIGCPEGFQLTVSKGIVSGLRNFGTFHAIQTDAPISHGSSGGPLLDMSGTVLGVTSFGFAEGQNLNFAIPSICIRRIIPERIRKYKLWGETAWTPASSDKTNAGRLAMVIADSSTIYQGRDLLKVNCICPKGTYLYVVGLKGEQYTVLMVDRSLGYIDKTDVELLNYRVVDKALLPIKSRR